MKIDRKLKPTIMPITHAALIFYYEHPEAGKYWDWGDFGHSHDIVETAGGDQIGPATTLSVSKLLAKSPLWNKYLHTTLYSGIGNARANMYSPSEKGKKLYEEKYKGKNLLKIASYE